MKIRFTESRWLDTEDRTKAPKFIEGSTHDLSDASAYRWTRRGYAVYVVEDVPPTLKVGRPMMGDAKKFSHEMAKVDFGIVEAVVKAGTPKKLGRPKKSV